MTQREAERLAVVEQKVRDLKEDNKVLRNAIEQNTELTKGIQQTLDQLTGAKKFLIWLTGFVLGVAGIIATWWIGHKTK